MAKTLRQILPKDLRAEVTVKVAIKRKDQTADRAIGALETMLADGGQGFKDLVREVTMQTLFVAYSNRFQARTPIMGRLIVEQSEGNAQKRAYYLVQLRKAERQLNQAEPDTDAFYSAKNRVSRYTAAYSGRKPEKEAVRQGKTRRLAGDVELQEYGGPKGGETSGFGQRMQEVLRRFKDIGKSSNANKTNEVTFRFGDVRYMEGVPTNGGETPSKFNVMWRQLEFGAGLPEYAKRAGNKATIPNLPGSWIPKRGSFSKERREIDPQTGRSRVVRPGDGSWFTGNGTHQVHILGSKAGNWLRRSTGAMYDEDAQLFNPVFKARLNQRLRGNS